MATEDLPPSPKLPDDSPFEIVRVPIPEGKDERHLIEVKLQVLVPSGYSMNDVYGALKMWLVMGSEKKVEALTQYGGAITNKTLTDPQRRKSYQGGGRMYCTGFDNERIPKTDTTVEVIRMKNGVKPSPVVANEPKPAPKKKAAKKNGPRR